MDFTVPPFLSISRNLFLSSKSRRRIILPGWYVAPFPDFCPTLGFRTSCPSARTPPFTPHFKDPVFPSFRRLVGGDYVLLERNLFYSPQRFPLVGLVASLALLAHVPGLILFFREPFGAVSHCLLSQFCGIFSPPECFLSSGLPSFSPEIWRYVLFFSFRSFRSAPS